MSTQNYSNQTKISHLILFAVLGVVLLLPQAQASDKPKSVFIEEAKTVEIADTYTYPSMAQALIESTILSEDQGFIKEIVTPLGSNVKKNQILATLKRLDPIYKFQALNLLSPIDGVVSKVFVRQGTNVAKGDPIFMVTDPSKSRLTIEVSAVDKNLLKKGDKGQFTWNQLVTPVHITGVSPIIDPATGTATVELEFTEKPKELPLGVLGQVSFKANQRQGFLVKADAIVYVGSKTFVRVVEAGNKKDEAPIKQIIKKTPVTLGSSILQRVEVSRGLKAQDWVVIRSSGFLKEGAKVEVKNAPEKPESSKKTVETDLSKQEKK